MLREPNSSSQPAELPNQSNRDGEPQNPKSLEVLQQWYKQNWEKVFYDELPLQWTIHNLDPLLGWLRVKQKRGSYLSAGYPLNIHRLEKDLIYLVSLSISKKSQLFLSFPITPVALGILTVTYYASLAKEIQDPFSGNRAVPSKAFVLWIRPHDNGKIHNLKIHRTSNSVINFSERLVCIPAYRFEEFSKNPQLQVVTSRTLSEGIDLLKRTQYCSLVVIDDPSGHTYLSPSQYGNKAFDIAMLCKRKDIPTIGIVPPWTMQKLEFHENRHKKGILLWAIDSAALRSYPVESSPFLKSNTHSLHPIEVSYQQIQRRANFYIESKVDIITFSFETKNEEKISKLFQESSDLLIHLSKREHLKLVWLNAWNIWRELTAPILPFYLLYDVFLSQSMKRLESDSKRSQEPQALDLCQILTSLIERFKKLPINPFLQKIESLNNGTTIAVVDLPHAEALHQFWQQRCHHSIPRITTISELQGQGGEKLVIIGQPKARHRDLLQSTFFHKVEVLLWSVLAKRADRWWSDLEIDSRKWHAKTWFALTGQSFGGRYEYSYQPQSIQVIRVGDTKLHKTVDISKLEECFSQLSNSTLDSGWKSSSAKYLDAHYLLEFEGKLGIRVSLNSEFLVLFRGQACGVSVKDIVTGTKVILFEGMNRDELFAQKAGLLEETRDNCLYHLQLDGWRALVGQKVDLLGARAVSHQIFRDTGSEIGETAVQYWMTGEDLLSLPRDKEHFFWFLAPASRQSFEKFWQKANILRERRRQLGKIISACAQEGWKKRNPDEIVFQYQQVFITVGELRDAMQVLKVKSAPQLIQRPPEYPVNRLFRYGE